MPLCKLPNGPNGLSRRDALGLVCAGLATLAPRVAAAASTLTFANLYGPATAAGIQLSAAAQSLVGKEVSLQGFMAPPLKAESDFFVLTRYPMSSCPFCSGAADWPVDIVMVTLGRAAEVVTASYAIAVSGQLEAGLKVDPATGFASLVRITNATWRKV